MKRFAVAVFFLLSSSCVSVLFEDLPKFKETECEENQRVDRDLFCVPCPQGTTRPGGDLTGDGVETTCEPVKCTQNQRVKDNICAACAPGTRREAGDKASGNDTQCETILCGQDQRVESNACVPCSGETTNDAGDAASGSDTRCDGIACKENHRVKSNVCVPCAPGSVSPPGADSAGEDTNCSKQPDCQINQAVKDNRCISCGPGTTNGAGDDPAGEDTFCDVTVCAQDQRVESNACISCPPSSSNEPGDEADGADTLCDPVRCGIDQRVESNACVACPLSQTNAEGDDASGPDTTCDQVRLTFVTTGKSHACAITSQKRAKCWGSNGVGQLGDGTTANSPLPVDVVGFDADGSTQAISAGRAHTCGLTSAGGVKCWGFNGSGQLGDGTTETRLAPVDVLGLSSGVRAVSAGEFGTCALMSTGRVMCWGSNVLGLLGTADTAQSVKSPSVVPGLENVTDLSVGDGYVCAVVQSGAVKCWGSGSSGKLGANSTVDQTVPTNVLGLSSGVSKVSSGSSHACVLLDSGGVKCWGSNSEGQIGDRDTKSGTYVPVDVDGLMTGVVAIETGFKHTCAITVLGGVKCWGTNAHGELATQTVGKALEPLDIRQIPSGATSLSLAQGYACVVVNDQAVKCWGLNDSGQLGNGSLENSINPSDVFP